MSGKYILVTGGSFINKGAQAMTFITVDQMGRRFPDCEVVLFSHYEARLPEAEKRKYRMRFMRFPKRKERILLRLGIRNEYTEIFRNAVAMLDISGYRLGSNWGVSSVKGYLMKIELARRFGIPVYLLPQSFGPFDFHGIKSWGLHGRIRRTLSEVSCIMAREERSYRQLTERYGLTNVKLTPDLVLQAREMDKRNIFVEEPPPLDLMVERGGVAVIPNSRNMEYGDREELFAVYGKLFERLLSHGKKVYLIYHAIEDLPLCKELKKRFASDREDVVVVERDLNCLEFSEVVRKLDFVVASRFHSIVHAYKEKVPALILGWADKYHELAKTLGQERFFFDVREGLDAEKLLPQLDWLMEHSAEESKTIGERLAEIQKDNVYDLIRLK